GLMAPGLLRNLGDVSNLAAMYFDPRSLPEDGVPPIVIAGGVTGSGRKLTTAELKATYEPATREFQTHLGLKVEQCLGFVEPADVVKTLRLPGRGEKKDKKEDEPIFEPGAKLVTLAGDGAGGEGPAWDPKLGVLTSGAKGIHQLTPEGEKKVFRE